MTKDPRQLFLPVAEFLAAAQKTRSPLDAYYEANYDDLIAWLNAPAEDGKKRSRISWPAVAEVLAKYGVMDALGNPPSEETARQTWYRVRKRMAARKPARKANGHRSVEVAPMPAQEPTSTTPLFHSVSEPKRSEP